MEKNDLGVQVVKQKRNFSQLLDLAPFPVHLNTPRRQRISHKNTSHAINKFSPSPARTLSFENDADGVRIHQRRTSYKLLFLEINKVNKYRNFFL